MKKPLLFKLIAVSLFALVSVGKANAQTTATDLFISEYMEGSSNNKAIEIFNGTGADVNLNGYYVKQAYNGTGWSWNATTAAYDSVYTLKLSGILASGHVYVIANAQAVAGILAVADTTEAYGTLPGQKVVTFNGNDGVGLFKGEVLIDAVGVPTVAPTSGWDVAGVTTATLDHTLVRKASVTVGTTDWAASAGTTAGDSQWIVSAKDDFSNLGTHTFGTVGLNKLSASKTMVYPNPATSYFNVKAPEGKYLVSVNNSIGSLVKTTSLNSTGKIEISDLQPGIYYVTIENVNTKLREMHKLIVR